MGKALITGQAIQTATGEYYGTGQEISSLTLEFPILPKFVYLQSTGLVSWWGISNTAVMYGMNFVWGTPHIEISGTYLTYTLEYQGNKVTIVNPPNASNYISLFNVNNHRYVWTAIG